MGYGGVIKEDKLGLEQIYIQAKRWDSTSVGRPEIQKFVGALHGKPARKGIFLTTLGGRMVTDYGAGFCIAISVAHETAVPGHSQKILLTMQAFCLELSKPPMAR